MDNVPPSVRSAIMARIKSRDTSPELTLRKTLFQNGLRYRIHEKSLPGQPDLVLKKFNIVIFVNGCFWHWHGCPRSRLPSQNVEYWKSKISKNQLRDMVNYDELKSRGWRVLVVWECALKKKNLVTTALDCVAIIRGKEKFSTIPAQVDA